MKIYLIWFSVDSSSNVYLKYLIAGKLTREIPSALGRVGKVGRVPNDIGRMPPSNVPSSLTGPTGPTGIQTNIPTMGMGTNEGEDHFYTGRYRFET